MKTAPEEVGTLAAKAGCLSHVLCVLSSNGLLYFKEPEEVPTICKKTHALTSRSQGMGTWM